jgi:Ankyrin repeats (3 copies)
MKKPSEKDIEEFFEAIMANDTDKVSFFLEKNPELAKTKAKNWDTPFFRATYCGHDDIAKTIASVYPNAIKEKYAWGDTPLAMAIKGKKSNICVSITEGYGVAKMTVTSNTTDRGEGNKKGYNNITKLILESYPDAAKEKGIAGQIPLHYAASVDNAEASKILLDTYPGSIKETDEEGHTPLHYAAALGSIEVAKLLMSLDPNAIKYKDKQGASPLHWAASMGHEDLVKIITKEYPQEAKKTDGNGASPLQLTVSHNKVNTLKILVGKYSISELKELSKGNKKDSASQKTAKSIIKEEIGKREQIKSEIKAVKKAMDVPDLEF